MKQYNHNAKFWDRAESFLVYQGFVDNYIHAVVAVLLVEYELEMELHNDHA